MPKTATLQDSETTTAAGVAAIARLKKPNAETSATNVERDGCRAIDARKALFVIRYASEQENGNLLYMLV